MASQALLEKLEVYRSAYELACSPLDVAVGEPDLALVKAEVHAAVRFIASDFVEAFNKKLQQLAQCDPIADTLAPRYHISLEHAADLEATFDEPVRPLYSLLELLDQTGDHGPPSLERASRAAGEAWARLDQKLKEKHQAYFVLTFQDLAVEVKADRDRRAHASARIDIAPELRVPSPANELLEFTQPITRADPPSSRRRLWAALALVTLILAGGWLAHLRGWLHLP